jgi:hypothetical protein
VARCVPIVAFEIEELGDGIDVDEVDDGEDVLGLPAGYPLAVWEQLAPLVLDVLSELGIYFSTAEKGE